MYHFSALLDNAIILMKRIHRNIMKNYMIVQWKIRLFETPWFQTTARCFSCWSQHSAYASRFSCCLGFLENLVEFSWVSVPVYSDISLGESFQVLCTNRASATEQHLGFTSNHRQSPFKERGDTPVNNSFFLFHNKSLLQLILFFEIWNMNICKIFLNNKM